MADEKKKVNKGLIAAICAVVVIAIAAVVTVLVINLNKGSGVVGKYTLSATVDSAGNEVDTTAASSMMSYTLELKDDKTGKMVIKVDMSAYSDYVDDPSTLKSETTSDITYDDKKMKISTNGVEVEADYEYKDGILTVEYQGQKMKFKKD